MSILGRGERVCEPEHVFPSGCSYPGDSPLPRLPEAPVGQEAVSQLWTQSFMILGSRAHLLWDLDGFTVGSILLTRGPAALGMEFSLQRVETVSPNCWRTCALGKDGFGRTPGVGDGQGGLLCCDSWGRKESDTTEQLN